MRRPVALRGGGVSETLQAPPTRRWWIISLLGALVLLAVGWGSVFFPQTFRVTEVVVLDAHPDRTEAIRTAVWEDINARAIFRGFPNIFLVSRSRLENELPRRFPALNTVAVFRRLPGTVRVVAQEKIPVALLFSGGQYLALDPTGVAFDVIPPEQIRNVGYPILRDERHDAHVELGTAVLAPDVLTAVHEVLSLLPERFHLTPKEVTIPAVGTEELHVRTHEEWVLLLDTRRPLEQQFAMLEKLFAEEIDENERVKLEYLDVRIPGKAFYTLKRR